MPAVQPTLISHPFIHKRSAPVVVAADLPYASSLVFNAGVIRYRGEYVMVFRNDYGTDREGYETRNRRFTGTGPTRIWCGSLKRLRVMRAWKWRCSSRTTRGRLWIAYSLRAGRSTRLW